MLCGNKPDSALSDLSSLLFLMEHNDLALSIFHSLAARGVSFLRLPFFSRLWSSSVYDCVREIQKKTAIPLPLSSRELIGVADPFSLLKEGQV